MAKAGLEAPIALPVKIDEADAYPTGSMNVSNPILRIIDYVAAAV